MIKNLCLLLFVIPACTIAQNPYDRPAPVEFINTYAPIDWGAIRRARDLNLRIIMKKAIETYDSYKYYPSIIPDGWHDVIVITPNTILPYEALVKANRIKCFMVKREEIKTDIPIVQGRCYGEDMLIYFFDEIERYNKRRLSEFSNERN